VGLIEADPLPVFVADAVPALLTVAVGAVLLTMIHTARESDSSRLAKSPVSQSDPAVIEPSDEVSSSNVSLLMRRDNYSCGLGNPCSNEACRGASGYCGYGKTYCGDGCLSNCRTVAECGRDAVRSERKCPLNTCCSQYGFCGTTEVIHVES
jgi:hypothetical protein